MKKLKKIGKILGISLCTVMILLGSAGFVEYRMALSKMPLEEKVAKIQAQEQYVPIEDISNYLLEATVSVEDQRFYTHFGIDPIAYGRIAYTLLVTGHISGGGSTITQQLSKNLYFTFEPSLIRKVAEIFMTMNIEAHYDKDEILELYVNVINYGDNCFGIGKASEHYFGIKPSELNFDQATLLAGIPQSPANYQLSNNEKNARKRQQFVIATIKDNEIYSEEELEALLLEYGLDY